MTFGHDPEVPAGYQDADIEMMEMRDAANEAYAEKQAALKAQAEAEAVKLDEQDLDALITMIQVEGGMAMAVSAITKGDKPTTRMVNLRVLETKLIKMKAALDE